MAVSVKIPICWYVTPCSLVEFYQHFRGIWCAHLQGWRVCQASICLQLTWLNLWSCRWRESTLLCNVGRILTGYMASNCETHYSSFSYLEQLIYNLETYQANLMPRWNFISFINTKAEKREYIHQWSVPFPGENKVLGFTCACMCVWLFLLLFQVTNFHKICYEQYATRVYVLNNGFCIFYR
jgi:hypothetical protein